MLQFDFEKRVVSNVTVSTLTEWLRDVLDKDDLSSLSQQSRDEIAAICGEWSLAVPTDSDFRA